MFDFLFKTWKGVAIHLVLAIVLSYTVVYYFFEVHLPNTTEHGMVISVPNLEHLPVSEAKRVLEEKELRLEIKDTVYSEKHDPGTVITQNPKPNFEVKRNRRVYITLNSGNVPKVTITKEILAKLVKSDINEVSEQLNSLGLKSNISYTNHAWKDYVFQAKFKNKDIEIGQQIQKGSTIALIVGNGKGTSTEETEEENPNLKE